MQIARDNIGMDALKQRYVQGIKEILKYHAAAAEGGRNSRDGGPSEASGSHALTLVAAYYGRHAARGISELPAGIRKARKDDASHRLKG